jgi:hypothetical protein
MIAYKLFRKRKDGTLGPLFINRKQRVHPKVWYEAEEHLTPGYSFRPGWHCCSQPVAPHLSEEGRVWCKVLIYEYTRHTRPESQGGLWFTAQKMKVLEVYENTV